MQLHHGEEGDEGEEGLASPQLVASSRLVGGGRGNLTFTGKIQEEEESYKKASNRSPASPAGEKAWEKDVGSCVSQAGRVRR